ncbi:hypothetical protein [Aeromicrobium sp. NPDC092404]|uniref:hypothetical protein n=1 Tax=Aeromicrobium sp. NPDC092404 TaxID=3154976 RepID=UPI0034471F17
MLPTEAGHLSKYLTTLGVAIVAATISLAGLFLRIKTELLIPLEELDRLTPEARQTVLQRQEYVAFATDHYWTFVCVGVGVGVMLFVVGLYRWIPKQAELDKYDQVLMRKVESEVRPLTEPEQENRRRAEAVEIVKSAPLIEPADAEKTGQGGGGENNDLHLQTSDHRGGGEVAEQMRQLTGLETYFAGLLARALGGAWRIDVGVAVRSMGGDAEVDYLITPRRGGPSFAVELKFIGRTGSSISTLRRTIRKLGSIADASASQRIPIIVVVIDDSASTYLVRHVEDLVRKEALESHPAFRWIVESESEFEEMAPGRLRQFFD